MTMKMHSAHNSTASLSGTSASIPITPFCSQNLRRLVPHCSVFREHCQLKPFSRSSPVVLTQESSSRREPLKLRCKAKGFEELLQKKKEEKVQSEGRGFGELLEKNKKHKHVERAKVDWCPCSRGGTLKKYTECCAEYHEGSIEPDALTLLKARYSAYARGLEPYIVKTHFAGSSDYRGKEQLEKDVHATCARLRFRKLEIIDTQITSDDETFITFKATYSMCGENPSKGQAKLLEEKARFVRQGECWLYSDSVPLSQVSKAAWTYVLS